MIYISREVRPGPGPRRVINEFGVAEDVPTSWELLPPGDAALSRRIKRDGPSLTVTELKGRKRFSKGIWAPSDRIEALRCELKQEREEPSYQRKLASGRRRQAATQQAYVGDFRKAVFEFLSFHPTFSRQAERLSDLICAHAVPVGSGTVARTQRLSIEERASAATFAWLRHQTTSYDQMQIPKQKGRRREIRRMLARRSNQLLAQYRQGLAVDPRSCPLQEALDRLEAKPGP